MLELQINYFSIVLNKFDLLQSSLPPSPILVNLWPKPQMWQTCHVICDFWHKIFYFFFCNYQLFFGVGILEIAASLDMYGVRAVSWGDEHLIK